MSWKPGATGTTADNSAGVPQALKHLRSDPGVDHEALPPLIDEEGPFGVRTWLTIDRSGIQTLGEQALLHVSDHSSPQQPRSHPVRHNVITRRLQRLTRCRLHPGNDTDPGIVTVGPTRHRTPGVRQNVQPGERQVLPIAVAHDHRHEPHPAAAMQLQRSRELHPVGVGRCEERGRDERNDEIGALKPTPNLAVPVRARDKITVVPIAHDLLVAQRREMRAQVRGHVLVLARVGQEQL
jgi:hypothetical protein